MSDNGYAVGRYGDKTTGHDSCKPVSWSENLSPNTFANEKAIVLKDSKASSHGRHKPTVSKVSSYTFANGRGWGLKTSTMSNCADKVNEVSPNVFANF